MREPVYAIYARVSHDDKVQDPEVQLYPMRQYCRDRGAKWIEYVDKETGRTIDRSDYQRAMDEIENWDIFMVVFPDRLTREGAERGIPEVRKMIGNGKAFQVLAGGILIKDKFTAITKAMLAMLFVVANLESDLISERTVSGLEKKRREIKENGYTISKKTGKKITGLGRQPSVRVGIEEVIRLRDDGLSLQQIADKLGSKKSTIHAILKREFGSRD